MSNEKFDFIAFITESKESIINPKSYFSSMKTSGGLFEPVIKALIYGIITGIFTFLWSVLKLSPITGGFLGGAVGFMALIWTVVGAIIVLFISAVIILILSAICGGKTDFEPAVRISAALMVLMPVSAFFNFTAGINTSLAALIALLINLYGLWMLYNALIETLIAKERSVKILSLVLAALIVLFLLIGIATTKKAKKFMDRYEYESSDRLGERVENKVRKKTKDLVTEVGYAGFEPATSTLSR